MAGNKLVQVMQSVAKIPTGETTDLLFGEVTSISPLKIKVDNRFEVDEQFLILSALVKETIIKIPNSTAPTHLHTIPQHETEPGGTGPHTHIIPEISTLPALPQIMLWRGLIIGDEVRLLRVNNGQMFYIIEREEGVL